MNRNIFAANARLFRDVGHRFLVKANVNGLTNTAKQTTTVGRGRDDHLIAPRADPHERSLAHAALIADE